MAFLGLRSDHLISLFRYAPIFTPLSHGWILLISVWLLCGVLVRIVALSIPIGFRQESYRLFLVVNQLAVAKVEKLIEPSLLLVDLLNAVEVFDLGGGVVSAEVGEEVFGG